MRCASVSELPSVIGQFDVGNRSPTAVVSRPIATVIPDATPTQAVHRRICKPPIFECVNCAGPNL